jgi:hypothetical protein
MERLRRNGLTVQMGFLTSNVISYVYWEFYAMACGLCRIVLGWQEVFLLL